VFKRAPMHRSSEKLRACWCQWRKRARRSAPACLSERQLRPARLCRGQRRPRPRASSSRSPVPSTSLHVCRPRPPRADFTWRDPSMPYSTFMALSPSPPPPPAPPRPPRGGLVHVGQAGQGAGHHHGAAGGAGGGAELSHNYTRTSSHEQPNTCTHTHTLTCRCTHTCAPPHSHARTQN
jgi:hypothetical protein